MEFKEFLSSYMDNMQVEGDFAVGMIDTVDKYEVFRNDLRRYGFQFTTRSSRKENRSFDSAGPDRKTPGRGSLMFKSTSDVSVPFFGRPFAVETTTYYTCSQGLKYYASRKFPDEMFRQGDPLAKKRRRPKATQKIGCQARMTVKKIKVFLGEDYYVTRDNWREKKAAIDNLRHDLEERNKVNTLIRFYILLSMDNVHNHDRTPRPPVKPRIAVNPAKKVARLQASFMEALNHLTADYVSKCTNITTLVQCCTNLKTIINALNDSIANNDGVPLDMVEQAKEKMHEKQLSCCVNSEKRSLETKKKMSPKKAKNNDAEVSEVVVTEPEAEDPIVGEAQIDGGQMLWDVSYVYDGQQIVLQPEAEGERDMKPVFLQRNGANLGVISQGGNYAIVQHPSLSQLSTPITFAKVVPPSTTSAAILPASTSSKKSPKKNEGETATLVNVDWTQQNWSQPIVIGGETFTPVAAHWTVSQPS